ncbi:restriction endonuclease [Bacillus altitudinis]|uniref:restriction endonuclease n=1 Tax=Bacillus pumilus TaxID=1408 RepID=UPI0025A03526|nr:restriction endonuclease [Bacillus pumilus]MDM5322035.1 restriction endonuclease [Bacillus pumilus]MDR4994516.1 restriction endonuclease [Bacillus altitudinis]
MTKWWMIRAGDQNDLIPMWEEKGLASIGWPKLGNPKQYQTKQEMNARADVIFAESKPFTRRSWVSQVWRFSREIQKGDRIITYIKESREYRVGTVTAPHFFDEAAGDKMYPNHIQVNWEPIAVKRDSLSQSAKNSLGSISTVFRVDDWGEEIEHLLKNPTSIPASEDETEEDEIIEDLVSKATVMIADKVDKLDPWKMQDLVGGLLQAMSYNVRVSPKGPDGGVDVLAYKDAFGFEKPIIKVQVKHRKTSASAPEVQQLLGANPMNANSLFVSTGGFTSHAKAVAKHNEVHLLDLEELVNLIVHWYEDMPTETRSLLPLKKVYVPE